MTGTEHPAVTLTRHEHVTAVLNDPGYVVPPPPELGDVVRGIGWLRSRVSRFSTGETHTRRRDLAGTILDSVDPTTLRRRARHLANEPFVPATVLAEALGIHAPVATLVAPTSTRRLTTL